MPTPRRAMKLLVLADDLTGALEAGAKFAQIGQRSVVVFEGGVEEADVLVVDTETRHLPPAKAGERVSSLVVGAPRVFKKTDSTLRGNIGSELEAVMREFPGEPLIYAAAYPALGRTVRQGRLMVNGRPAEETEFASDPHHPVRESSIPVVIRAQADVPVRVIRPDEVEGATESVIYVVDGETDADLEAVARVLRRRFRLAAGPAGLCDTGVFFDAQPVTPSWPVIHSALVINGSLHPVSRAQAAQAGEWTVAELEDPARHAVEIFRRAAAFDALVIFGGDTAVAVLRAMGESRIEPVGEIVPGVPVSRMACGRTLITKAGGFGPPDVLRRIQRLLKA